MPKPDRSSFRPESKDRSSVTIDRTQLGGALKDTDGEPGHLKMDPETGGLRTVLFVWDTKKLQYVRQTYLDLDPLMDAIGELKDAVGALTDSIKAM